MTLTKLFSDIADAIRAKTGSTEPIVAADFPAAIAAIQVGGGNVEEDEETLFDEVNWLDTVYAVGQNTPYDGVEARYTNHNGWAPGNAVYDKTRGVVVFLQVHGQSHNNGVVYRTICTINPYRPMDSTLITTFPDTKNTTSTAGNGIGGLIIDKDGTWHVFGKKYNYHSSDGGASWSTEIVLTSPETMYGVTEIDGILYAGDDTLKNNGVYYVSSDNGLNWETKTFDFADDYPDEITCSEASFCKFQGKIYANLRRENTTGLLARLDDTGWVVINEEMPNLRSDTTMYAVDDAIYMAAINRDTMRLILASYDGETVKTRKVYDCSGFTESGDFHTPTYVVGDDFQMVTFMTGYGQNEYFNCINACVVGYKDGVEYYAPTYTVELVEITYGHFNTEGPMTGTITTNDDGSHTLAGNSWYNISIATADSYPPNEDGNPVSYGYAFGTKGYVASSLSGWGHLQGIEHDGELYVCLAYCKHTAPALKLIGKGAEYVDTSVDMTGADYCIRTSNSPTLETLPAVRKMSGVCTIVE